MRSLCDIITVRLCCHGVEARSPSSFTVTVRSLSVNGDWLCGVCRLDLKGERRCSVMVCSRCTMVKLVRSLLLDIRA